jgi:hypothetical protein
MCCLIDGYDLYRQKSLGRLLRVIQCRVFQDCIDTQFKIAGKMPALQRKESFHFVAQASSPLLCLPNIEML